MERQKNTTKKSSTFFSRRFPVYLVEARVFYKMAATQVVNVTLPSLPAGWSAEKDFKPVGALSSGTQRNLEPVGPYFLAHARRVSLHGLRHNG